MRPEPIHLARWAARRGRRRLGVEKVGDDDRGASALELAFIGPSLIALIFFAVQVALYFYGRSVALQAAREGVSQFRLAQTQAQYDAMAPQVTSSVSQFASGVGGGSLADPVVLPTYDDKQGRVSVTVTGKTISLVPFLHLNVTQQASGQIERFQDPG